MENRDEHNRDAVQGQKEKKTFLMIKILLYVS